MNRRNPIRWIKRENEDMSQLYFSPGTVLHYRGNGLPYVIIPAGCELEKLPDKPGLISVSPIKKRSWWKTLWLSSFLSSCATVPQAGPSYYERCGAAQWEYRYNVERETGEDALMENSGRRNCIRFSGPDACLTRMEKLSNVEYRATCSTERKIMLRK